MNFAEIKIDNRYILYDKGSFQEASDISFDSSIWAQRDAITGFAEGRGTTFFVNYLGQELALRHYHRGGLIARWSSDSYLWLGLRSTRAWKEFNLLRKMRELKLPVPVPVAAQVIRHGLFYTADIMTRRITGARTVGKILTDSKLDVGYWISIGSLVRRFHDRGIYHADLNANNIMLDPGGRFYLIDFDRGEIRRNRTAWKKDNLMRLKRSLTKLKENNEVFYFSEADWEHLLTGYNEYRAVSQ